MGGQQKGNSVIKQVIGYENKGEGNSAIRIWKRGEFKNNEF